MKRSTKALLAAGAGILCILVLVAAANAQGTKANRRLLAQKGPGAMFRPMVFLRGLDLSQQQKDQVKTILANHKAEIKTTAKGNIQARLALRAAIV